MAFVPVVYPGVDGVAEAAIRSGRPVIHATPAMVALLELYLAGYVGRRWTHAINAVADAVGDGHPPNADGHAGNVRLMLPTTPHAQHIFLRLDVAARTITTAAPTIVASLRDLTGAVIDIGCSWTRADQTLPAADAAFRGAVRNQVVTIGTGIVAQDGLAVAGVPSSPRMLYLGASAGTDVELRLVLTNVVLISVSACEFWEASL